MNLSIFLSLLFCAGSWIPAKQAGSRGLLQPSINTPEPGVWGLATAQGFGLGLGPENLCRVFQLQAGSFFLALFAGSSDVQAGCAAAASGTLALVPADTAAFPRLSQHAAS